MNNQIFFFFYSFAHQFVYLDKIFIFLAEYLPYLVVIGAIIFLFYHYEVFKEKNIWQIFLQKKKEIFCVLGAVVVAWILSYVFKILIASPRPFNILQNIFPLIKESGYGFPSGHATFFMALAFSIFFLNKKVGYIFMALAVLIGIARIITGVHFPLDILGGFVLGGVISYLFAYFVKNV